MINKKATEQFARYFENTLFSIIKGFDGKGIERLEEIVERRRVEIEERKKALNKE